ncbi:hypothetical protein BJY04DRAFT_73287 [Aspergillus karnatakaensis]|uniref:uncharacterized protein n=1 Tax=Aspergillus karnatakaensis TaxID=1810916 RepID=UPI003CCD5CC9
MLSNRRSELKIEPVVGTTEKRSQAVVLGNTLRQKAGRRVTAGASAELAQSGWIVGWDCGGGEKRGTTDGERWLELRLRFREGGEKKRRGGKERKEEDTVRSGRAPVPSQSTPYTTPCLLSLFNSNWPLFYARTSIQCPFARSIGASSSLIVANSLASYNIAQNIQCCTPS